MGFANMSPFELQVTYRLDGVLGELKYKITESDRPLWKKLLNNSNQSIYARLCAAYFLLDKDHDAQNLIRTQLDSDDLRHRYNAAKALFLFLAENPKSPMMGILLQHLANGSLDGSGAQNSPDGKFPEGDRDDIMFSPAMGICFVLGNLKCEQAVPVLSAGVERNAPWSSFAVTALGNIGDPAAIPTLLEQVQQSDSKELNRAFGQLKCKEAVPLMIGYLSKTSVYPTEADQTILEAFGSIGDLRAVDPVKDFLHQDHAKEDKAIARRVLAQLDSPDPVGTLIDLFDKEHEDNLNGEVEKGRLLDALLKYPDDKRVTEKLSLVSQTSNSSFVRTQAINDLGRLATKPALLELANLMNKTFPTHLNADLGWKGNPPDFRYYFPDLIVRTLKEATHQDLGIDSSKWKSWIDNSM